MKKMAHHHHHHHHHHSRRTSTGGSGIELETKVLTADVVSCDASEIDAQVKKLTEPCQDPRLRDYPNRFVAMTVDLEDGRFFLCFWFFVLGGEGKGREGGRAKGEGEREEKGVGGKGSGREWEGEGKEGKRKERWKGRAGKVKRERKEKREKKERKRRKTGCVNVMGMRELLEKSQDANSWSFFNRS